MIVSFILMTGKGQGIVDFGYKKHFRVHHGKNEFARGNAHINGIESFYPSRRVLNRIGLCQN